MNTALWQQRGYDSRYAHCWVLSILLHGTAIGLAIALLSDLRLATQPDAFRWQVSVVGTTSAPDVQAAAAQREPRTVRPTPLTPSVNEPAPPQKSAAIPPQAGTPTVTAPEPPPRSPTDRQERSISEQIHPAPQVALSPNVLPQVTTPTNTSQSAPSETATLTPSTSPPPSEDSAHTSSSHLTPPTTSSTPVEEPAASPSRDASTYARVPLNTPPALASTHIPDASSGTRPSPSLSPPVREANIGKPDFSWLTDSLRNNVKESQKYSTVARLNGMEGRVVLRITVKENGDLVVAIAKSSGHERLDQDALEQVKRLSPLSLPQSLGRAQQVLNLPIIYSLNQ